MLNPASNAEPFPVRAVKLTGRALELRCPKGGLQLERGEQGYVVGAYMLNIAAAEAVFILGFMAVLIATWPTPS